MADCGHRLKKACKRDKLHKQMGQMDPKPPVGGG